MRQQDKEMSIEHFKSVLKKIRNKDTSIKLLGGEPTLHSTFETIIALSLNNFKNVQIFTNGIFSSKISKFLRKQKNRVKFTFNIMTPGFLFKKDIRELVISNIRECSAYTDVTLSITLDPYTDVKHIVNNMSPDIVPTIKNFRIGVANPIETDGNRYPFADFPKLGGKIYKLIQTIKLQDPSATFTLNCGLTRCMFTDIQIRYFKNNKTGIVGWGCWGKKSSMDVTTDMSAIHCFSLSQTFRLSIKKTTHDKTEGELLLKRHVLWKDNQLAGCKQCLFYGYGADQCPGPCLAYSMNALRCQNTPQLV